ncbi:MAG: LysR family transcriptional regulator, partial [Salinisphaera sp.]|nr:LysR family transcriptional regulator [Salinisphaera sp.]
MHAHSTEESKSPAPPASSPLPIAPLQLTRRVTLRQLEVFVEAARQLNFSRVAEAMHLTQPAVSMQIRQVEQAVGLPLFDRQGRQKRLNEAGNLLLHYASRMLGELRDAEHGLQAMKGLAGGSVAVGLVSTAQYFAPRLVAEFTHAHPHIDVRFVLGNRGQLVRLLQENQIDLAVMGRPPP